MEPAVTLHEDCHYVCPESSPCNIHYLLHEETQVFNWLALEERCLVRDTTQYLCHLDHLGKTLYIPYVNNETTVAYRPGKVDPVAHQVIWSDGISHGGICTTSLPMLL